MQQGNNTINLLRIARFLRPAGLDDALKKTYGNAVRSVLIKFDNCILVKLR